jgi:competence protein ComEA
MMKKILAIWAMLFTLASWAAVDVNKATDAELDGLKGVGPALSKRIMEARAQGAFKDWPDFMARVKGVKEKSAAKLSAEGLTINGQAFGAASTGAASTASTASTAPTAKTTAAAAPTKPAAPAAGTSASPAAAKPATAAKPPAKS